jgi:hypothetical protein
MSNAVHDVQREPGQRIGQVARDPDELCVQRSGDEPDRDRHVAQGATIIRHLSEAQDAQGAHQTARRVCAANASLLVRHITQQLPLAGKNRLRLPGVEKCRETALLQRSAPALVAADACSAFAHAREPRVHADQRGAAK